MIVEFAEEELGYLKDLAKKRNQNKYSGGQRVVVNQRVDTKMSEFQMDYEGILGEAALCKYFGISVSDYIGKSGDDGYDLEHKGNTYDTKFTKYRTGHLLFRSIAKFTSDIAVLVIRVSENKMRIAGYIKREDFVDNHVLKSFGHKKSPAVSQEQLGDIEECL